MAMEISETKTYVKHIDFVRGRLPERKVDHSISVARMMLQIAPMLGLEEELCAAAGLLHDICRALPAQELLERAQRYGLAVTDTQQQHPMLLHGPVAAEECRRELNLINEEMYEAIYFHTTGRPFLKGIGQALYLSDFSEPFRKYPEAAEARAILEKEGFEKALVFAASKKYAHVQGKKFEDPETCAFYAWLQREYP